MGEKPKAVFFGTPGFSCPALGVIAQLADVRLVVCQPDKGVGRGRKLLHAPVKSAAEALSLPVMQPEKLKKDEFISALRKTGADFFFTVAYGKIIPESILTIPRLGCLNLHASLLPKYRGAAPIQWAVINGERSTGFTLMLMDAGMDTGDILDKAEIEILPGETAGELSDRMSLLARGFIQKTVPLYLKGELRPEKQDDGQATYAPMLKKEDGRIDWSRPAHKIVSQILGMNPWPMAYAFAGGKRIRILRADQIREIPEDLRSAGAGLIRCDKEALIIKCGSGAIRVTQIQAEGKKVMDASCFLKGTALPDRFDV